MPFAGLPQEVTVRPHMPSSSQIQWTCYRKWKAEWEAQIGMSTSTFKHSCGYAALDMLEWREMTEQTDWLAKQLSQVACISEDPKCWGAWDPTCGHKAKDITSLITLRREAWKEEVLDNFPWNWRYEREPLSIRWTLELFQRQHWGNSWDSMGFSEHVDTILNWTEMNGIDVSCAVCFRRGLNPPHRVKSISMASFTPEEMDFLKSHGNDVRQTHALSRCFVILSLTAEVCCDK